MAGRPRPGQARKSPLALRLGQWRGLPAQGPARRRHRPTRARRSPGRQRQAAQSDRRPGPPRLPRPQARPARFGVRRGADTVDWAHDAKFYQFWNDGREDGRFTITNVRPGSYTLHAFADGVLGEFAQADITVSPGKTLDLGKMPWKPVRYGKQLWEIGYPDRTGGKFYKGDGANYWLWGWCVRYGDCFPTTSPTPSARAITARTGSSSRCRTNCPPPGRTPPPRTRCTSASAG